MQSPSAANESVAIIVRGHERGALQSEGLRTALVGLLGLVGPGSRVFVRSWAHSDAPPGSTWRASSVEPRIRLSAQGPRRALSRAQLCSYFQVGLLGARLAGCELEDEHETAARRGGRYSGSRARVWSAPVVGQQQMWAQQLRALEALDAYAGGAAFTAAVSLRIDLFSRSFAMANGLAALDAPTGVSSGHRPTGKRSESRADAAPGVSSGHGADEGAGGGFGPSAQVAEGIANSNADPSPNPSPDPNPNPNPNPNPDADPDQVAEGIARDLARRNSSQCAHALATLTLAAALALHE